MNEDKNIKTENHISTVLDQIEKAVDEKLKNVKSFVPVLFTVIISLIAYISQRDVDKHSDSLRVLYFVYGTLFVMFILMMISFIGRKHYEAKEKTTKIKFKVHRFDSYCNLSDYNFMLEINRYASRELTDDERVRALFVKQKINEYIYRRRLINVAFIAFSVGAGAMAVTSFWLSFS